MQKAGVTQKPIPMSFLSLSFGIVIPTVLVVMGIYSIFAGESIVPMSKGFGRFSLGGKMADGYNAVWMGIAYLAVALLLCGTAFQWLRKRHPAIAGAFQVAGFGIGFFVFGYVLLFSR